MEYEKAIKRNFKSNSLHRINLETIEFDSKLDRQKTNNLARQALTQANSTALPKNHKKRIQIIDVLYRLALQNKDYYAALVNLEDIMEIKKELYGEDSPEYHYTVPF